MATATAASTTCLTAIFARAIQADEGSLPPEAAQAVLRFTFPARDQARMQELVLKNQAGDLPHKKMTSSPITFT